MTPKLPRRGRRAAVLTLVLAPALVACTTRDDDYLLLRRTAAAGEATELQVAAKNDPEAHYLRHLLASGFGAELMRTYAMTKRFAARTSDYRDTETTIALGRPDTSGTGSAGAPARPRRVRIGWWKTTIAAEAPIVWIDDGAARGPRSSMADLVAGLGGAIVDVIAPETGGAYARSAPLRAGYLAFLQVVGSEWRPPRDIDDRDELRQDGVPAWVRTNAAVWAQESTGMIHGRPRLEPRPGREMIGDRLVVATVLYRMASELGQKMAEPAVYEPFLEARPPKDVHPALLLGAFRNFQAKLLAAWSRASAAGRPPHDLVDLVEAYATAYPAERPEVTRIFLVTTYGATARANAVRADETPDRVQAELASLTADVLFGRRGLRDGLMPRSVFDGSN
jgi:hypothetical protein